MCRLFSKDSVAVGYDLLSLFAKAFNTKGNDISGQEEALWFHRLANTWRSAGGDDIARLQDHVLGNVGNDVLDGEDHRAGLSGLHPLSIDIEPHGKVLDVLDLIGGHEPWSERTECRATLAFGPGAAALKLELAL